MATLPTLTTYDSNLIPNKATMTDEEFADAIHPYLNFWNETTIPEINNWRGTLEQIRQEINDKYIAVKNQAIEGGYSQAYLDTQYNPPMTRTYYVDAVDGDDTNDGSSGRPFKTIKKAVDSVPIGGSGVIKLFSGVHDINNNILLERKNITIISSYTHDTTTTTDMNNSDNFPVIRFIGNSTCFIGSFSKITFGRYRSGVFIADDGSADLNKEMFFRMDIRTPYAGSNFNPFFIEFVHSTLKLQKKAIRACDVYFRYTYTYLDKTDTSKMLCIADNTRFETSVLKIYDFANNELQIVDNIGGIVKDTNGTPRNIISRTIF